MEKVFPISRDPPEGGTSLLLTFRLWPKVSFQFLGIPPKGELQILPLLPESGGCFQFLGIPPKGEQLSGVIHAGYSLMFPISRDPPEGGTMNPLPS